MKFVKLFNLGEGINGSETFTGTNARQPATNASGRADITVGVHDDDFFKGQITNLSGIDVRLSLFTTWKGTDHLIHSHDLRAYESIEIKMPLRMMNVIVNGTVILHGMGVIVRPETKEEEAILWASAGLIERLNDGRYYRFPTYDHTDIATATTTTLATPASGATIRVYKITVSVQAAARPVVEWTDANGTSNINILGTLNFAGEGTFVYDFGDKGLENPNGANGLLRLLSNNTAVLDIDVISEDVVNQ